MRRIVTNSIFGIVVLLGWILPKTVAIFPVELIRVVFVLPSMLLIDSPGFAWLTISVIAKVFVIAFWLGLPRIPNRRPIRSELGEDVGRRPWSLSPEELAAFFDMIAKWDENQCFARMICHLQSMPEEDRTLLQNAFLKSLWNSAFPSLNDSSRKSPRWHFVTSAYFAEVSRCFNCCTVIHPKCTLDTQVLLDTI